MSRTIYGIREEKCQQGSAGGKMCEKIYFRENCTELVITESKEGGDNCRMFIFLGK